jgi:hypothetical protein
MRNNNYNRGGGGFLPPYVKLAIGISIIGVVGFIAYKLYKKAADIGEGKDEKATLKLQDKELKEEMKKGETLSKPLSSYQSTANAIEQKLAGLEEIATEVQVIQLVISQVKKPIDWLQLSKAFGKRNVTNAFGFGSTTYDLGELLKDQLDHSPGGKIVADNFVYDPIKSGKKTSYEVLNIYLKKIGITI